MSHIEHLLRRLDTACRHYEASFTQLSEAASQTYRDSGTTWLHAWCKTMGADTPCRPPCQRPLPSPEAVADTCRHVSPGFDDLPSIEQDALRAMAVDWWLAWCKAFDGPGVHVQEVAS